MKMYCSQGGNLNCCYGLDEGVILIGRSAGCDIVLNDPHCSRKHAVIIVDEGEVSIVTAKRRNPVIVNGHIVKSTINVEPGCTIRMGASVFNVIEDHEQTPTDCSKTQRVSSDEVHKAVNDLLAEDLHKLADSHTTKIKRDEL